MNRNFTSLRFHRSRRGITQVELLAVIAIIVVLAAILYAGCAEDTGIVAPRGLFVEPPANRHDPADVYEREPRMDAAGGVCL